ANTCPRSHTPWLVLKKQFLLGPGVLLLPTDPRQLLLRDLVAVLACDDLDQLAFLPIGRRRSVNREARILTLDTIDVVRPPAEKKGPLGHAVGQRLEVACAPMIEALGGGLHHHQAGGRDLREAFLQRLQALYISVVRTFCRMDERISDTLGPANAFIFGARHK